MPRYRLPAYLYVDALSVPHAVDIFRELCAENGVVDDGIELDRASGAVVYLPDDFVWEVDAGESIDSGAYLADGDD